MLVRLTKKLAALMNGVDVSSVNVGDTFELPEPTALMMVEEGWAVPIEDDATDFRRPTVDRRAG